MADLLFSGVKPTSTPHLGNYLGALKPWTELQHSHRCFFCIVDHHAITVPQDPAKLRAWTLEIAAIYLAIGLDPERCTIFIQSEVPEHTELGWILGTLCRMSELERMTQFKDKSRDKGENVGAGLFTYPALMAADILLYDTTVVPVGEDQLQHLELTRLLARRFNQQFGETFFIPQPYIQKIGARLMSLTDPTKKMSKSDPSPMSCIYLTDDADVIRKKISRAVTDSATGVQYDEATRPAISNLMTIYHHATGKPMTEIEQEFEGKGYAEFKQALAEAVVHMLHPFQHRFAEYQQHPEKLQHVLDKGRDTAREIASKKLANVKQRMGLGRSS